MTNETTPSPARGWLAGWNQPGCLPDAEPAWFGPGALGWAEAAAWLADEAEAGAANAADADDPAAEAAWATAAARVRRAEPDAPFATPAGDGLVLWLAEGEDPEPGAGHDPEADEADEDDPPRWTPELERQARWGVG